MAIIQISRIIQRSGNLVDLPQLAEAELGWANDARRLFVGRGGSYDAENVEVLTSYSDISFGQIEGSYGNLDFSSPKTGQIISYNRSSNTWVNTGGNAENPGNTAEYSNNKVHLGDVGNVKLGGGALGYVLETDGQGNLSWATKGTLRNQIYQIYPNAVPLIITIDNSAPYVNSLEITITGANATNANSVLNGKNFYVSLANDFPISGNVSLYTDAILSNGVNGSNLSNYVANSGVATALLSSASGGSGLPDGATGAIQFKGASGNFQGSASLVWNIGTSTLSVSGNANISSAASVGSLSATGVVRGSQLVSTAISPTAPIVVSSQVRIANANVQTAGNLINGTSNVIVNTNSNIAMSVGGTANVLVLSTTGISVSGNANVGNIGIAGLITATGNIQAGNLRTANTLSVGGNANIGNIGVAGVFATTLSATGNANVGNLNVSTAINANGNINANNFNATNKVFATGLSTSWGITTGNSVGAFNGLMGTSSSATWLLSGTSNGTFRGGIQVLDAGGIFRIYEGSNVLTFSSNNLSVNGTVSAGGNISTPARLISTVATGTAPLAVSSTTQVANLHSAFAGTVTTNAQPNITSVGNLTSLTVTGNANLGNVGAINGVFTNISGSGSGLTSLPGANVIGIVANANYAAFTGNVLYASNAGNAIRANTVTTNAQPNITSVGTLSNLVVSGNTTSGNFTIATDSGWTSLGSRLYGKNSPSLNSFWIGLEGSRTEPGCLGIGIASAVATGAGVVNNITLSTTGTSRVFVNSQGNTGINTTDPRSALHVFRGASSALLEGDTHTYMELYPRGIGSGRKAWMGFGAGGSNVLNISQEDTGVFTLTNLATQIHISRDPLVGVASIVNGNTKFQVTNTYSQSYVDMYAPNFISTSDIKLKKNIQTISNALSKVSELRGVSYNLIENEKPEIGLIAQEVEKVIPEIVHTNNDIKHLEYGKLSGLFVEAIKELNDQIIALKQEISELRKK